MRLPAAASALAFAAAFVAAPALAASAGNAPGRDNPSNGGTQGAASQPGSGTTSGTSSSPGRGGNPATEAGAAGTSAITNPAALGTAPNPGPRGSPTAPTQGSAVTPAAGGTNGVTAPGSPANSAAQNATPSQRNPVLTKGGWVRASRVIGSAVYDGHDQKIGTIDDILLGTGDQQGGDQQAGDRHGAIAVISVGGFLGIGSKLVAVPYSKLQFGDTSKNTDNRVVMPDATKAALNGMPSYHYRPGKA
ncbi:MAG TPA: hypothetical protein VHY76_11600 [Acetobacteraceae bacterium]|nr:hypothetical protein [Acetobacteraceae bacterium]